MPLNHTLDQLQMLDTPSRETRSNSADAIALARHPLENVPELLRDREWDSLQPIEEKWSARRTVALIVIVTGALWAIIFGLWKLAI